MNLLGAAFGSRAGEILAWEEDIIHRCVTLRLYFIFRGIGVGRKKCLLPQARW